MFRLMKPSDTKIYREEEFLYCQDIKRNSQISWSFGSWLRSHILKISYNIHKCLCHLLVLLRLIGFGLEILWPLIVANVMIFCHVAPYFSVYGTNVEKELSAITLVIKHFTPKTEPTDFSES